MLDLKLKMDISFKKWKKYFREEPLSNNLSDDESINVQQQVEQLMNNLNIIE